MEDDPEFKREFGQMLETWKRLLTEESINEAEKIVPPGSRFDYMVLPLIASRVAMNLMNRCCTGCDGKELLKNNVSHSISSDYSTVTCRWNDAYTEDVHIEATELTRPFHEVLPFVSLAAMRVAKNFVREYRTNMLWLGLADSTGELRRLNR